MELNWIYIPWRDVSIYLNQTDIIELSLVSKSWNTKLIPILYNRIIYDGTLTKLDYNQSYQNIQSLINEKSIMTPNITYDEYEMSFTSTSNNICDCTSPFKGIHSPTCHIQISKIKGDIEKRFKKTRSYVIDLKILSSSHTLSFQHHYNLPLVQHFPNLRYLTLESTKFNFDTVNYLFKGLARLEHLELIRVCVFANFGYIQPIVDLQFPISVKSLYIDGGIVITPESENNVNYADVLVESMRYLHFRPQYLPKLKSLVYTNSAGSFDSTITEFIDLNPQLQYLGFSANALTTSLLSKISSNSSLKKLAVIYQKNLVAIPLYPQLPMLSTIEHLEIELSSEYSIQIFKELIQTAPNICHLHIHLHMLSFDVYHNLVGKIDSIAGIFTKLKTLSITSHSLLCDFLFEIPSFPNLTHLNLLNARLHKINLIEYEKYSMIKCIYLSFNHPSYRSNINFDGFAEKFKNWKINYFHKSMKCYNIKN